SSVAPGGTVTITWAGIPSPTPTDWFALVPINAPDTNWVAWVYADGRSADSTTFVLPSGLPAGKYDLRLLASDTFTRRAISNIVTITSPGPALATSPVAVANGGTLNVSWQGIASPTPTDWIGVYALGAPDANYLMQVYTNGQSSGGTMITLGTMGAGAYE